ncbi:hypothetical protein [Pseudomonas putida]|uniref:Uncharacterized protein n=1 Tax=Pseudomonas putida TaxID=303 RepID=A0A8I1E9L4_PSEPU|nr:hypothetical protein [Pseudomonas putida]MBI6882329.1 hypothetical protein [Pseudomonas putida]
MKLVEHKSPKYPPRTIHNAKSADLTVAFAVDFTTYGEERTHDAAGEKYIAIDLGKDIRQAAKDLYIQCRDRDVKVLNVAGNGEYTTTEHGWNQDRINLWVYQVLALVHKHHPLEMVISGGQTGVDFAGGVAAELLGIEGIMTFPKGYLQRTVKEKALTQSEEAVRITFDTQVETLREYVATHQSEMEVNKPKPARPRPAVDDSPSP